jgi:chorismate synthase
MLRFLTAGESHGMALIGIIEGLPAGLRLEDKALNQFLERRQKSYGRGTRMKKIEKDRVTIVSGLRDGATIGSPLSLQIENKDWANRKDRKSYKRRIPRPGHADLAGVRKYGFDDIQNVIERSSARETAMRTAVGALANILLSEFGIDIVGYTRAIGRVKSAAPDMPVEGIRKVAGTSPVYCADSVKSGLMCNEIDKAKEKGETLGGMFEVMAARVPPGLGSYVHWDRRLDGNLARAIMSIPSVKAVEVGEGIANAARPGSRAHDRIGTRQGQIMRPTNRAGGIEGGVSNGEAIVVRGYTKPIPSLRSPLPSVELDSGARTRAPYVRSDVCVVPAISVIAEAVTAWVLAEAFVEKFGGDSVVEMKRNHDGFISRLV